MFTKNITNGIVILTNGKWNFSMTDKGELYIRGPEGTNYSVPIAKNIGTNLHGLVLQSNGNLVIVNSDNQVLWSTGTSGNSNAYLELTDIGELVINNSKGIVIYKLFNRVTDWLNESKFYENCPDILFSDKAGRFFEFKWADYNRADITNNIPSDTCGYCRFRGWMRSPNDNQWNVTELDITSIDGYKTLVQNGDKPKPNEDDGTYNYNSEDDRNRFYNDGGDKIDRKNIKIFASRLEGGSVRSNYLPGYDRISYVDGGGSSSTYKFLISDRDGWKQAFVLYRKKDKIDFITSVVENKNLIRNLKNYWRNRAELPTNINFV
jgi:hypothetical protein